MTNKKSKKLPTNNETVKFKDLKFKPWGGELGDDQKQAVMYFDNGYGVSVLIGNYFYRNGVDTYELAVLKDEYLDYDNPVADGEVRRYLKKNELMKLINQVKNFK